jgi:hypothetical protein
MINLIKVYVSVTGDNLLAEDFKPSENDDSYRICETTSCDTCDTILQISYDEPIATCECGSQEWYL